MGFVRTSFTLAAATALGAGLFIAAPAQGATYPPTQPVRCGARVQDGNDIGIKIRPLQNKGYKYEVLRRKSKGNWKVVASGRTRASDGQRVVRNLKKGSYRVRCVGAPNRLDGITSAGKIR